MLARVRRVLTAYENAALMIQTGLYVAGQRPGDRRGDPALAEARRLLHRARRRRGWRRASRGWRRRSTINRLARFRRYELTGSGKEPSRRAAPTRRPGSATEAMHQVYYEHAQCICMVLSEALANLRQGCCEEEGGVHPHDGASRTSMSAKSAPLGSARHRSPGAAGNASVSVPVVTNSPARSGSPP